jgi:hypothetical protein
MVGGRLMVAIMVLILGCQQSHLQQSTFTDLLLYITQHMYNASNHPSTELEFLNNLWGPGAE